MSDVVMSEPSLNASQNTQAHTSASFYPAPSATPPRSASAHRLRVLTGFVLGLLTGLVLALVVALYVSRVPVPFMNRGQDLGSEVAQAKPQNSKNWDPNSVLKKVSPPPGLPTMEPVTGAGAGTTKTQEKPASTPALSAAPPAPSSAPTSTTAAPVAGADRYVVQAGAFTEAALAEKHRTRLEQMGLASKFQVEINEQNGKSVFRVRSLPVAQKFQAEALQDQLKAAGIEAALLRLPR